MRKSSLLLNANDLRELVGHVGLDALMDQMIERLAGAVRGYDIENSQLPVRQGFNYSDPEWGLLEWMPAYFRWANGGESVGLIPTRYPGSEHSENDRIRIAARTEWVEVGDDRYQGLGQRLLATDVDEYPLMDLRSLTFDGPSAQVPAEQASSEA